MLKTQHFQRILAVKSIILLFDTWSKIDLLPTSAKIFLFSKSGLHSISNVHCAHNDCLYSPSAFVTQNKVMFFVQNLFLKTNLLLEIRDLK